MRPGEVMGGEGRRPPLEEELAVEMDMLFPEDPLTDGTEEEEEVMVERRERRLAAVLTGVPLVSEERREEPEDRLEPIMFWDRPAGVGLTPWEEYSVRIA